MSSRKTASGSRRAARTSDQYSRTYYYGSAAPSLETRESGTARKDRRYDYDEQEGYSRQQRRAQSVQPAGRMNPALVLGLIFLVGAMCVGLFGYIGLQSEVTNAVEEISSLESQLSELRSDNDEALNAINSGISLDEVKYRAIAELGMIYAQEDQIITYSNDDSDYVRQVIQP